MLSCSSDLFESYLKKTILYIYYFIYINIYILVYYFFTFLFYLYKFLNLNLYEKIIEVFWNVHGLRLG